MIYRLFILIFFCINPFLGFSENHGIASSYPQISTPVDCIKQKPLNLLAPKEDGFGPVFLLEERVLPFFIIGLAIFTALAALINPFYLLIAAFVLVFGIKTGIVFSSKFMSFANYSLGEKLAFIALELVVLALCSLLIIGLYALLSLFMISIVAFLAIGTLLLLLGIWALLKRKKK